MPSETTPAVEKSALQQRKEELLLRHARNMRRISDRDRQLTTALATIHTGMILVTGAHGLAVRGNQLVEKHADKILAVLRDGQEIQNDDPGTDDQGSAS